MGCIDVPLGDPSWRPERGSLRSPQNRTNNIILLDYHNQEE